MDASRTGSVAQYEFLQALVRLFPDPLIELRDLACRIGAPVHDLSDNRQSNVIKASVRDAVERLQALSSEKKHALDLAESLELDRPDDPHTLNAWADRWHLHPLLDLAPHIRRYWAKRPAAAEQLYFPGPISPIMPSPRITDRLRLDPLDPRLPCLAHPDDESEEDYLERARQHYRTRLETLSVRPWHRRRKLRLHAEWYMRHRVQGWTLAQIAEAATTDQNSPDLSTITKGIKQFTAAIEAAPVN